MNPVTGNTPTVLYDIILAPKSAKAQKVVSVFVPQIILHNLHVYEGKVIVAGKFANGRFGNTLLPPAFSNIIVNHFNPPEVSLGGISIGGVRK